MKRTFFRIAGLIAALVMLATTHAHAGDGKSALRLMPENTALVISFNVARAKQSAPGKQLITALTSSSDMAEAIKDLRTKAGLDIHRDIDTFVMTMASDFSKSEEFILLVEGRFKRSKIVRFARQDSSSFKQRKHRGVAYYEFDDEAAFAFLDKYFVMTPKAMMRKVIDVHKRKARSAQKHVALMSLIKSGDTSKDLWAGFIVPPELRKEIAQETGGHSVNAMIGTIDMASGLNIQARMDTTGKEAASAISTFLRMGVSEVAGDPNVQQLGVASMINKVKIRQSGVKIDVSVSLTGAELDTIKAILSGAMP